MKPRIRSSAAVGAVLLAFGCTDAERHRNPVAPEPPVTHSLIPNPSIQLANASEVGLGRNRNV